ncbi:MAG: TnpV protein [Synergistaceae bacterium]|nr:TnpV protein [Synergistaceae bacterium]
MPKNNLPDGVSAVNFMTDEELTEAEDRVFEELETKAEEDLTIYHEEDLTESDKADLPEGTLMRETGDGMLYVKVVDIWTPYQMEKLKQPPQPLTKYGRMRRKYLEEWKVRTALELGENLLIHCLEVQEQAKAMKSELMSQLESQNPSPDRGVDPMGWVQHMNSLDMTAEEIVLNSVIYS